MKETSTRIRTIAFPDRVRVKLLRLNTVRYEFGDPISSTDIYPGWDEWFNIYRYNIRLSVKIKVLIVSQNFSDNKVDAVLVPRARTDPVLTNIDQLRQQKYAVWGIGTNQKVLKLVSKMSTAKFFGVTEEEILNDDAYWNVGNITIANRNITMQTTMSAVIRTIGELFFTYYAEEEYELELFDRQYHLT